MTERDEDLRAIFRTVAEGANPRSGGEGTLLAASRRRRLMTTLATLSVLLLIAVISGASMLMGDRGRISPGPGGGEADDCVSTVYDLAVFVPDGATEAEIESLRGDLLDDDEVEEAIFFSKHAAFEEFKEHYADQPEFWENLPENALPMSFRVTLMEGADVKTAVRRFNTLPSVEAVRTYEQMDNAAQRSAASDCGPNPDQRFARYFFEAAKADMAASGVVEVDSEEGTICLEGTFSPNIVAAHLIDRQASDGVVITFFDPDEEPEDAFRPGPGADCVRTDELELLQLVIADEERFAVDFHRGPNDEPGLIAELRSVLDLQTPHVRATVGRFMQTRVDGAGAERFLHRGTWTEAGPPGASLPLYPDPPPKDFRIEFIDDLGDVTYEVGVSLIFEGRTSEETLFVRERNAGVFVIEGARPGLEGP